MPPADGRITPAYAGRRTQKGIPITWEWDHPRVRGEKTPIDPWVVSVKGSPPRTRGEDRFQHREVDRDRITPAYAGRRPSPSHGWRAGEDHPRVRGEKSPVKRETRPPEGSPPRTRGEAIVIDVDSTDTGITPAYAGRRTGQSHRYLHRKDHPRVRGEKFITQAQDTVESGSPPRTRGEGPYRRKFQGLSGITPAYAGRSGRLPSGSHRVGDHPRVRGEKICAPGRSGEQRGSPPRTRGEDRPGRSLPGAPGITPAYAGRRDSA